MKKFIPVIIVALFFVGGLGSIKKIEDGRIQVDTYLVDEGKRYLKIVETKVLAAENWILKKFENN